MFLTILHVYILRCGIAGSYENSMFSFFKECQNVFHSGHTILHSHQQWFQLLQTLTNTYYSLSLFFFLILAILMGLKLYLIVVLI